MVTRKGAVAKHSPSHSSAVPAPSEMGPLAQRSAVKASLIEKDSLRPEGDVSKRQREDGGIASAMTEGVMQQLLFYFIWI